MSKPLWSGRFDSAPDPAAFDFGVSFPFDRRLFEDDVTGSLAWAEALSRAGVLTPEDAAAIDGALREILERGRHDTTWVNGEDEDVRDDHVKLDGVVCTPAARATNRYRSICASICGGGFRSCRRNSAPRSPRLPIRPRPPARR